MKTSEGTTAFDWRALGGRALRRLLPNHCYLCGAVSEALLCPCCQGDLPRATSRCYCCALPYPLQTAGSVCGDCLQRPKPFTRTVAAFDYAHPVDFLVNRFKHQRHFTCGGYLADALLSPLTDAYGTASWPELLVPVPLHWSRLWKRGFNQGNLIARRLGQQLSIPVMHACKRRRRNSRQQGLKRGERLRNLRHAFTVTNNVDGLHLALVDDVMTTGATVTELTACLNKAGAARVDVWVLARVP